MARVLREQSRTCNLQLLLFFNHLVRCLVEDLETPPITRHERCLCVDVNKRMEVEIVGRKRKLEEGRQEDGLGRGRR